jgi:hypothetical protein
MKFLVWIFILPLFANEAPFWKKKENVYQRITQEKEIIVSAKIITEEQEKRLNIVSAGHIQAPLDFTWKQILDFQNYNKITDHFKDIKYDAKNNDLFFNVGALGYYASLWLKLKPSGNDTVKTLEWHCYKGSFKDMRGVVTIEKIGPKTSEISMLSNFSGKSIPIPDILIRFGLELIGKQMATKMRSYIEDGYKNDTSID